MTTERADAAARVERVLPATREVVFDAWLDPDALRDWMCPRPARCVGVTIEPRAGGRLRLDIEEDGTRFFVAGQFRVVDRPHRLTFTWHCSTWPPGTGESVVTVEFQPHGQSHTLMTIDHQLLPAGLEPRHERGWRAIGAQLAASLEGASRSPAGR
jgi:uncharacterized protein YndB with AHSA1/START domain